MRRGVEMTAANLRAPPPLSLQPGHANEEGHRRGMAAPRQGWLEVVNKNKSSEIIGVLVASNAVDLALKGHDVNGYLTSHLCVFPADTVFNAQKAIFSGLSRAAGDSRAEDRTGRLLRRVEITGCGVL